MLKPSILNGTSLVSATLFGVAIQNVRITINVGVFGRSRQLLARVLRRLHRDTRALALRLTA